MDTETKELAIDVANAAWEKKAQDLVILNLSELVSYTDFFIICSGSSDRQVQAIADSIERTLKSKGTRPFSKEGAGSAHWIIIDYGSVVAHIFYQPVREYYELERLWSDAPHLEIEKPIWITDQAGTG